MKIIKICFQREMKEIPEYMDLKFAEMDRKYASKEDFAVVRKEGAESKSDLIKWMFIFWVGQVVTTFCFILLSIKR